MSAPSGRHIRGVASSFMECGYFVRVYLMPVGKSEHPYASMCGSSNFLGRLRSDSKNIFEMRAKSCSSLLCQMARPLGWAPGPPGCMYLTLSGPRQEICNRTYTILPFPQLCVMECIRAQSSSIRKQLLVVLHMYRSWRHEHIRFSQILGVGFNIFGVA